MSYKLIKEEKNYLSMLKETTIRRKPVQEASEDYKKFFKQMMKSWNINSIEDLSDEKKKKFFSAVDKAWKSDKEKSK